LAVGRLRGCLGKAAEIVERTITPLQGALVEKTQLGHAVLDTVGTSFFSWSE